MHVDTVGAAVDLGGAHFHEVDEAVLEAGFGEIFFEGIHRLLGFRGIFTCINSRFHVCSSSLQASSLATLLLRQPYVWPFGYNLNRCCEAAGGYPEYEKNFASAGQIGRSQRRARSLRTASSIRASSSLRVRETWVLEDSPVSLVSGSSAPPPGGGVTEYLARAAISLATSRLERRTGSPANSAERTILAKCSMVSMRKKAVKRSGPHVTAP